MRILEKPNEKIEEYYNTCISKVRGKQNRAKLGNYLEQILTAAKDYDLKASKHELFKFTNPQGIDGKALIKLYTNQVGKKNRPGRYLYNQLMELPVNTKCPFCGIGRVKELDHFLPKSVFESLSIVPFNLVPSCRDCNQDKKTDFPRVAREQTLHPYYDNTLDFQWLFARLIEKNTGIIEYYVDVKNIQSPQLASKVKEHFKSYDLYSIYRDSAAEELLGVREQHQNLLRDTNSLNLIKQLKKSESSFKAVYKNSWQVAMYEALAGSDWYTSGKAFS